MNGPSEIDSKQKRNEPGLRMAELMATLSLAIDIGVGMPMEWVLRTCLLAMRLGEAVGLGETERQNLYYLSLLWHVGCTSTSNDSAKEFGDETKIGSGFEVDFGNKAEAMGFMFRVIGVGKPLLERMGMLARMFLTGPAMMHEHHISHCEIAERLAERLEFPPAVTHAFWQIYERWDGKGGPRKIKGEALAMEVRILHLAQDAATLYAVGGLEAAVAAARKRSGGSYDPALVEIFCKQAGTLLAPLSVESVWDAVLGAEPGVKRRLSEKLFDAGLETLADFSDLKSPYLLGRSREVAKLAASAARLCGLTGAEVDDVRRAALMQDIGRVGVTSGIWSKPGGLTDNEWERVRLHPYYTERILARSPALARLGELAASHHERLDGTGYHRRMPESMLPVTARLLAAADVYRALIEERPHRAALPPAQAAEELLREAKRGRLDGKAVDAVLAAAGQRPGEPAAARLREGAGAQGRPSASGAASELSPRELEVLRLLVHGLPNREMARKLFISPKTVGHHIQHIYAKINVSSRAGAALYAVSNHLLEITSPSK